MTQKQRTDRQTVLTCAHTDFQKGLHVYAHFKVSNQGLSEDLVQETFMKTWLYLAKGGKIDLMKAFLYHILNNLIIDEYRKKKTASLDALLDQGVESDRQSVDDRESLYDALDGKAALGFIARVSPIYQKVMRMRYIQDLSLQEMSTITGQSRNAVGVQIHRGLKELKSLYIAQHVVLPA